jgi:hypothetical protein
MSCAERIVDKKISELSKSTREPFIVRFLAAEEPRILEEQDFACGAIVRSLHCFVSVRRLDKVDTHSCQFCEALSYWLEGILRVWLALRAAEM